MHAHTCIYTYIYTFTHMLKTRLHTFLTTLCRSTLPAPWTHLISSLRQARKKLHQRFSTIWIFLQTWFVKWEYKLLKYIFSSHGEIYITDRREHYEFPEALIRAEPHEPECKSLLLRNIVEFYHRLRCFHKNIERNSRKGTISGLFGVCVCVPFLCNLKNTVIVHFTSTTIVPHPLYLSTSHYKDIPISLM